jgi:hypothetical protein
VTVADEETDDNRRITVIEMPDLSHLNNNYLCIVLDYLGSGHLAGPTSFPQTAMWVNLVRLSDKALREYGAARSELLDYVLWKGELRALGSYMRGTDHLENCVEAVHRAAVYARNLQADGLGRDATAPKVERFRAVRDLIAHADDRIARTSRRGRQGTPISEGHFVALTPRERELCIGSATLAYVELAAGIASLHGLIARIREAEPPITNGA